MEVARAGAARERLSNKGIASKVGFMEFSTQGGGKIPQIGFGTAGLFGHKDVIREALKMGYRHIDTALLYGTHKDVRDAIRESGVAREDIFITTKVGFWPKRFMFPTPPPLRELLSMKGGYVRRNEKTRELEGIQLGLQELGTTYADLCLIHTPAGSGVEIWGSVYPHWFSFNEDKDLNKRTWKQWILDSITRHLVPLLSTSSFQHRKASWLNLEKAQQAGYCKYIGVSNYEVEMLQEMESYATVMPAVNQLELHPLRQMKGVRDYCNDKGIAVTGYGSGIPLEHPTIAQIASKHKKTPMQVILAWAMQIGTIVIPKTKIPAHAEENLDAANKVMLDEEDMNALASINKDRAFYWQTSNLPFGITKKQNKSSEVDDEL
eukprot:CAMPEP_0184498862 /NCGR_PEP_ID=MMETSP0113_2-20130426/40064_1 /TAXON_ID=91329 /ORGANISM="Norrisiella sphaerica, Strain BC52" /LENGTH=377 /DNA_ID=CAMNT_0026886561 /DNA_START=99 /DNA_END=1232 /DNA_ORIENTATION=+